MVTVELEDEGRPKRFSREEGCRGGKRRDGAVVSRARRPKSCSSLPEEDEAEGPRTGCVGWTERWDRPVPRGPGVPTSYPRAYPFSTPVSPFSATLTILKHNLRRRMTHTAGPRRRPRRRYSRYPSYTSDVSQEDSARQLDDAERANKEKPILVFRRIARIVRMLCCVCLAIRKYAIDAGYLDNYQVNVSRKSKRGEDEDDDDVEEEELTFNLKDFKLRRELVVPPRMVQLLHKRPSDRTRADIHSIALLMRGLPSFRKYTPEMQELFSKIVRYMKCGKRRVVLRKGHIGYNLYFIYSGSVSVVLDKDDGNVFVKPEVVYLRKGACFGEIALLQATRRTATIVCAEDTEFLVIDKEDFIENGLNKRMQDEFRSRYMFFRKWPPLDHWTDDMIKALSYIGRQEEFHHNKVIVKDSTKNEWLWFIVRGSCNILRLVDLERCPDYRKNVLKGPVAERFLYGHKSTPADICRRAQSAKPRLQSGAVKRPSSGAVDDEIDEVETATTARTHDSSLRPQTSIGFRSVKSEPDSTTTPRGCVSMTSQPLRQMATTILEESPSVEDMADGDKVKQVINSPRPLKSSSDTSVCKTGVGCGIFVKIDTLRDGQCFGLDMLFDEPVERLSLVSQGCEVIHFPRPKFKEMADRDTMKIIRQMLRSYPPDNELCRRFLETSRWDSYKNEVVESVVAEQQRNTSYENVLRHGKRVNYLHQVDKERRAATLIPTTSSKTTIVKPTPSPTKETPQTGTKRRTRSQSGRRSPTRKVQDSTAGDRKAARRTARPRTCPPNISRRTSLSPSATTAPPVPKHPTTGAPSRRLFSTDLPTTTYYTKAGYQVEMSNLRATGSKRTLQLVHTVKSPSHENRMALIRMK